MPKPPLRIAVLTLRPGDEAQLDPGPLSDEVRRLINAGTLSYTAAPDDWTPFNDGTPILRHLQDGLDAFEVISDSASVAQFRIRRGISLFVIDPAVLLHPGKRSLAVLIQEHVCSREDKASCIVIRGTLPAPFFADLETHYTDKFSDLMNNANGSLFDYQVGTLLRLKQFLKRVTPLLGDVPDSERHAEAARVLAGINRGRVPAIGAPTIGVGGGG
jgi:hypothetical protein